VSDDDLDVASEIILDPALANVLSYPRCPPVSDFSETLTLETWDETLSATITGCDQDIIYEVRDTLDDLAERWFPE